MIMPLLIEWNICTGTSASKTLLELVNMVILKKYPKLFLSRLAFSCLFLPLLSITLTVGLHLSLRSHHGYVLLKDWKEKWRTVFRRKDNFVAIWFVSWKEIFFTSLLWEKCHLVSITKEKWVQDTVCACTYLYVGKLQINTFSQQPALKFLVFLVCLLKICTQCLSHFL